MSTDEAFEAMLKRAYADLESGRAPYKTAEMMMSYLRHPSGRWPRFPIPPASDTEAWDDGENPYWERDVQLAAVAVLRDLGLVEITTDVFEEDITDDDPGVTIYVQLAGEAPTP
jgi:hypothetical protein